LIAELEIASATVGAFAIVFVGNLIWNYAQAPKRMQAEADSRIGELESNTVLKTHFIKFTRLL
jgi:hypothetical protein